MTNPDNKMSDQDLDNMLAAHFDSPRLYADGNAFIMDTLMKIQKANKAKFWVRTLFTIVGFGVLYLMVPWVDVVSNWGSLASTPVTTSMVLIGAMISVFIQGIALAKNRV